MTLPEGFIPDDVWKASRVATGGWMAAGCDEVNAALVESVARAILAEREQANSVATDRLYMMKAYRDMLGPLGAKVAAMWEARGVQRVHLDVEPNWLQISGEERAATILEWDRADNKDGADA